MGYRACSAAEGVPRGLVLVEERRAQAHQCMAAISGLAASKMLECLGMVRLRDAMEGTDPAASFTGFGGVCVDGSLAT